MELEPSADRRGGVVTVRAPAARLRGAAAAAIRRRLDLCDAELVRVAVPPIAVATIFGKGGANIRRLRDETGVIIDFEGDAAAPRGGDRLLLRLAEEKPGATAFAVHGGDAEGRAAAVAALRAVARESQVAVFTFGEAELARRLLGREGEAARAELSAAGVGDWSAKRDAEKNATGAIVLKGTSESLAAGERVLLAFEAANQAEEWPLPREDVVALFAGQPQQDRARRPAKGAKDAKRKSKSAEDAEDAPNAQNAQNAENTQKSEGTEGAGSGKKAPREAKGRSADDRSAAGAIHALVPRCRLRPLGTYRGSDAGEARVLLRGTREAIREAKALCAAELGHPGAPAASAALPGRRTALLPLPPGAAGAIIGAGGATIRRLQSRHGRCFIDMLKRRAPAAVRVRGEAAAVDACVEELLALLGGGFSAEVVRLGAADLERLRGLSPDASADGAAADLAAAYGVLCDLTGPPRPPAARRGRRRTPPAAKPSSASASAAPSTA